jgi:hypothetical protein
MESPKPNFASNPTIKRPEQFHSYDKLKKMYEDMRRNKQYHLLKKIHMLMPKVLRKN